MQSLNLTVSPNFQLRHRGCPNLSVVKKASAMPRRGRSISLAPLTCVSSARSVSGSDRRPAEIEPKIDTGDDCLDVLRDLPCVRPAKPGKFTLGFPKFI
jgi:hypothetical protein